MKVGFRYYFTSFKSKFNKLTTVLADTSDEVKKDATKHYHDPSVEVDTLRKVGFRKYVVIFKVTGEVIEL